MSEIHQKNVRPPPTSAQTVVTWFTSADQLCCHPVTPVSLGAMTEIMKLELQLVDASEISTCIGMTASPKFRKGRSLPGIETDFWQLWSFESSPSCSSNTGFCQGKVLAKPCLVWEDGGKAAGTGQILPSILHLPLRVTPGVATMKRRRVKTPRSWQHLKRNKEAKHQCTSNSKSSSK